PAFLAGTGSTFQASLPLGVINGWGIRQSIFAVYGQDDYTVNSRLTLNLGLRWETSTDPYDVNGHNSLLPSPAATSTVISGRFFSIGKKNIEPRFGIAWKVNDSGKTVVRAGGGIYHNTVLPWAFSSQLRLPPFQGTALTSNAAFPNAYQSLVGLTPANTT